MDEKEKILRTLATLEKIHEFALNALLSVVQMDSLLIQSDEGCSNLMVDCDNLVDDIYSDIILLKSKLFNDEKRAEN